MRRFVMSLLGFGLLTLACSNTVVTNDPAGGASPTGEVRMVGDLEGTDTKVGLVADGGRIKFFLCGTGASLADHTRWLAGTYQNDATFSLSGGVTVTGKLDAAIGTGSVTFPDGSRATWRARRVPSDTVDGLYESTDDTGRGGVVVNESGTTQGAFIMGVRERFLQITPLRPVVREANGIRVRVEARELTMPLARP
jgi:hypothetical protein